MGCGEDTLDAKTVEADPSFDVFSLGAVLFEACSRTPLFPSDRSDDNLVEDSAKVELSNWLGIDKVRLSRVFKTDKPDDRVSATDEQIKDCKHLLRWCLQGDPAKRPRIDEVLAHRFLTPGATAPDDDAIPELWHCFLSQVQQDASGTVGTLYYMLHYLGSLSPWVDMHEENLTLEGMKADVRKLGVFPARADRDGARELVLPGGNEGGDPLRQDRADPAGGRVALLALRPRRLDGLRR